MLHLLHHSARIAGLGLLLIAAGCSLNQQAASIDYYTISSDAAAEFSLPRPVRVARVRVPEYIDNDRLWVRTREQKIEHISGARWAESLGVAITRELRSSLGIGVIEDSDWPLLLVTIDRLEARWAQNDDAVVLVARWALETKSREGEAINGQIRLSEPVANRSASAVARATAAAVNQMNQGIGEELIDHLGS